MYAPLHPYSHSLAPLSVYCILAPLLVLKRTTKRRHNDGICVNEQ